MGNRKQDPWDIPCLIYFLLILHFTNFQLKKCFFPFAAVRTQESVAWPPAFTCEMAWRHQSVLVLVILVFIYVYVQMHTYVQNKGEDQFFWCNWKYADVYLPKIYIFIYNIIQENIHLLFQMLRSVPVCWLDEDATVSEIWQDLYTESEINQKCLHTTELNITLG